MAHFPAGAAVLGSVGTLNCGENVGYHLVMIHLDEAHQMSEERIPLLSHVLPCAGQMLMFRMH